MKREAMKRTHECGDRGKDCLSLELSSNIHFSEWRSIVNELVKRLQPEVPRARARVRVCVCVCVHPHSRD